MAEVLFVRIEDLANYMLKPTNLVAGNLPMATGEDSLGDSSISAQDVINLLNNPPAGGDVVGPASASDNGLVVFDATTGKLIKQSTLSGLLKLTSGVTSAAVSGTDYAPATSGSSILKGDGSGGFSNAASGTDYAPATSGSSILKGNGSGGFSNAASGTDYAPATSGSSILKGNGSGGFSNASSGTDYAPATSGSGILKGNGSGGFSTATAGTDYVKLDTTSTFTAGYKVTSTSGGTITGANQTFTPSVDSTHANMAHITLNGSSLTGTFTFAVPSGPTSMAVEVLNGGSGSVGATLSTSGYTKVTGDTYATTNGNKYMFYITKSNSYSHLHIQALQ